MVSEPFKATPVPPLSVLLNPVAWALWTLDFNVWAMSLIGPLKWLMSFRSLPSLQVGDAWRNAVSEKGLHKTPYPECKTVHELMQRSFAAYAEKPACGTRKYLGTHQVPGSKIPLQKFGATKWINYKEFGQNVTHFGAGLLKLGMKPTPPGVDLQKVSGPHTMIVYEETCESWMTATLGAFTQSLVVATSYATLGMSAVGEAINETNAHAIVCNIKNVKKVADYVKDNQDKCSCLKAIIYTTNYSVTAKPEGVDGSALKILSVDEVLAMGAADGPVTYNPPTPDHLGVIMYTSGSTGKPKGVMIKHSSMAASVASLVHQFSTMGVQVGTDRYVAYLPAAHILELCSEITSFCYGSAVGFADPKTISSKGACRQRDDGTISTVPSLVYPPGALQEFRPTTMVAVPKIWDVLKKGVEEQVGKGSSVAKFIFRVAFSGRYWAVAQGREAPVFKKLIFQKVADVLGGNLKIGATGGGPISPEVQGFCRTVFCMPLLQGYALTETTCAGTAQPMNDTRFGVVGIPHASVEIKLRDCVDKNSSPEVLDRKGKPYMAKDKDHYGMSCSGRGEVLIRGPSVSSGYFKQQDKTDEVYDKDGWFHTGDIGLFTTDGSLMLVDRLKNLVKLKGGEYIAIEAMEAAYGTTAYVNGINGGIMCYGDGDMDRPVALVQANTVELTKWATSAGVSFDSVEALCKMPEAEKAVLASLVAAGKAADLGANEILCAISLIPGTGPMAGTPTETSPWTADNGGLTASNKLNRKPIGISFASLLDPLRKKAAR